MIKNQLFLPHQVVTPKNEKKTSYILLGLLNKIHHTVVQRYVAIIDSVTPQLPQKWSKTAHNEQKLCFSPYPHGNHPKLKNIIKKVDGVVEIEGSPKSNMAH